VGLYRAEKDTEDRGVWRTWRRYCHNHKVDK